MSALPRFRPDMPDATTATPPEPKHQGYITVPLEGRSGIDLTFGMKRQRSSGAAVASLVAHVVFVAIVYFGIRAMPEGQATSLVRAAAVAAAVTRVPIHRVVSSCRAGTRCRCRSRRR